MQIVTFTYKGQTRVGIKKDDHVAMVATRGNLLSIIRQGVTPEETSEHFALDDVKLEAPLIPGKIIAVGRNYAKHAKELNNKIPEKPLLFVKVPSSVIGSDDMITWSETITTQVDWEGELAVIIGKRARNISEEDAYSHVYGYCVGNDVSARDLQISDGQWVRAKGLDTFCPLGPAITLHKYVADPHDLTVITTVNGDEMQNGHTSDMIFKIPFLISYISKAITLEAGDVILTGTPDGVGKGQNPPRFLQDGDTINVSIAGLGEISNRCKIVTD